MNKKENRRLARQAAQQAVLRDKQNRRIQDAAAAPSACFSMSSMHPGRP